MALNLFCYSLIQKKSVSPDLEIRIFNKSESDGGHLQTKLFT